MALDVLRTPFRKIKASLRPATPNTNQRRPSPLRSSVASRGAHVRVHGDFVKMSEGLHYVLDINEGEILVQAMQKFEDSTLPIEAVDTNEKTPWFIYIEPGPNVAQLAPGNLFTIFFAGMLFLMRVVAILRPPVLVAPEITTWNFEPHSVLEKEMEIAPNLVDLNAPFSGEKFARLHGLHTPNSPAPGRKAFSRVPTSAAHRRNVSEPLDPFSLSAPPRPTPLVNASPLPRERYAINTPSPVASSRRPLSHTLRISRHRRNLSDSLNPPTFPPGPSYTLEDKKSRPFRDRSIVRTSLQRSPQAAVCVIDVPSSVTQEEQLRSPSKKSDQSPTSYSNSPDDNFRGRRRQPRRPSFHDASNIQHTARHYNGPNNVVPSKLRPLSPGGRTRPPLPQWDDEPRDQHVAPVPPMPSPRPPQKPVDEAMRSVPVQPRIFVSPTRPPRSPLRPRLPTAGLLTPPEAQHRATSKAKGKGKDTVPNSVLATPKSDLMKPLPSTPTQLAVFAEWPRDERDRSVRRSDAAFLKSPEWAGIVPGGVLNRMVDYEYKELKEYWQPSSSLRSSAANL